MISIAEIRKAEILDHFYKVISSHGFSGTTLEKIAKSMGVKPSLLLHYYKSKEEIISGFVDFIIRKYEDVYISSIRDIEDPEKRLLLLLDLLFAKELSELVNDKAFYECYSLSITHPEVKEKFRSFYERFREKLIKEISILRNKGVVTSDPMDHAADFLIVLLEGKDLYSNLIKDEHCFESLLVYLKAQAYKTLTGREIKR